MIKLLKTKLFYSCFMLFLISCFFTQPVKASYSNNYPNVYDDADLLSDTEEEQLANQIVDYENDNGATIIILTVNTVDGEKPSLFAHNFANSITLKEGIVILVNMELDNPSERGLYLQNYKSNDTVASEVFTNITARRCDEIYNEIKGYFSNAAYYDGFSEAIHCIDELAQIPPEEDDYPYPDDSSIDYSNEYYMEENNILTESWVQLLIALVIGGVSIGCMLYSAGGKITTNSNTYLNRSNSKVVAAYDHYIRTSVSRVKRPKDDNNHSSGGSSNSSSHSGGGGSSHGGGGGF